MKTATTIMSACSVAVVLGLLSAGPAFAQQQNSMDLSPAKSNCDSKTGCANYSTGNVTNENPMKQTNSNSPYDQGGANPAQSNCDSKTGCANYSTGQPSTINPTQQNQK